MYFKKEFKKQVSVSLNGSFRFTTRTHDCQFHTYWHFYLLDTTYNTFEFTFAITVKFCLSQHHHLSIDIKLHMILMFVDTAFPSPSPLPQANLLLEIKRLIT